MANTDLERFVAAQDSGDHPVIDTVRQELRAGRKRTHWMWFVFPQLRALGRSPTALHYGLAGRGDAAAYIAHPVLGPRLLECVGLMDQIRDRTALQVLGSPDDLKYRSCLTLFRAVEPSPFQAALNRYYDGMPDPLTLELLDAA